MWKWNEDVHDDSGGISDQGLGGGQGEDGQWKEFELLQVLSKQLLRQQLDRHTSLQSGLPDQMVMIH